MLELGQEQRRQHGAPGRQYAAAAAAGACGWLRPPLPPPPQQAQRRLGKERSQPARKDVPGALPLDQAARVSTSKCDAHEAVASARGRLERSGLPAEEQQAQLDAALCAAVWNANAAACLTGAKLLVEAGASAAAAHHISHQPPLQFLLARNNRLTAWTSSEAAAVVETLVAAGGSAATTDSAGWSSLEHAVIMRDAAAARGAITALAAAGADLRQVGSRGKTLLHRAAEHGLRPEGIAAAIPLLLDAGCSPLALDSDGKFPYQLLVTRAAEGLGVSSKPAQLLLQAMAARCAEDEAATAKQQAQQEAQRQCVVCMDRPREVALLPCGHLCCCIDCAAASNTCPYCRQAVKSRPRIYIP